MEHNRVRIILALAFLALALLAIFLAMPALAQSRIILGGVDQRVPAIENQILAQQLAEKTQQAARAAAMLTLEQQDRKEAEDRATAAKAWLDQAWKEMEYWRAYASKSEDPAK